MSVHYSVKPLAPCAICHKERPQHTRPFTLRYTERHRDLLGLPSSSKTEHSFTFTVPTCGKCYARLVKRDRFLRWRNWGGWGAIGMAFLLVAIAEFLNLEQLQPVLFQLLGFVGVGFTLIAIGALLLWFIEMMFIGDPLSRQVAQWLTKYADPNPFLSMPQFIRENRLVSGEAGIEELLNDLPSHRPQTIKSLGAIKDPRAFDALVQTFQFRSDPNVVDALLASGDQRTTDVLLEVLKKPYGQSAEFRTKVRAVLKTLNVSDERIAESVAASARSGGAGPEVVGELVELGDPQIVGTLLDALKRASTWNPAFKVETISKLATLGRDNPQVTSAIIDMLQDKERTVRAAAATALGELGDLSTTEALVDQLQDDSPSVRRKVTEALHKLNPTNDSMAKLLRSQRRIRLAGNLVMMGAVLLVWFLWFSGFLESSQLSKDLQAQVALLSLLLIPIAIVLRSLLIDSKKRYQRFREQWLQSVQVQSRTRA